MRLFYFLFLLSFSVVAQNPKLEVKITSITNEPISAKNTAYHINYQIENKTSDALSFFLLPNALIANTASSLTLYPVYKMYQNGVFEDMDGPFFEYETDEELKYASMENNESDEAKKLIETIQSKHLNKVIQYYKNYKEKGGTSEDYKWVYQQQKLLNNIIILKPNETRSFTIKTLWNKNRFIKNDDLEYYLDPSNKIEIELILDLKTNLFSDQLSEEDLKKINDNPNFVRGYFVSNKFAVNFKD